MFRVLGSSNRTEAALKHASANACGPGCGSSNRTEAALKPAATPRRRRGARSSNRTEAALKLGEQPVAAANAYLLDRGFVQIVSHGAPPFASPT